MYSRVIYNLPNISAVGVAAWLTKVAAYR